MVITSRDRFPVPLLILILVASLLIILGAVFFYQIQKEKILTRTYNELDLVTSLKAEEIRKWRQEHIRDGYIIGRLVPVGRLAYYILEDSINERFGKELQQRMELFIEDYDYHSIVIVDNTGRIRYNYPESATSEIKFIPFGEFKSGEIEFSDLHYSNDMPGIHIDMMIPIIPHDSTGLKKFGTIILRIDPEITLFPAISMWSTPSRTAEILLIRRDGDSVTYLNNKSNTFGKPLKKSIYDKTLPAALAVEGKSGFFEGRDYRNNQVLSYLRKIPNSPWFLVAKVDKQEALAFLYKQTVLVSIIALLFIIAFITTIFYLWRSQHTRFYKELSSTKDKFVSIITHDLTNPFVSIVGFSDFLIKDLKKGNYTNTVRFAEIIHDSSLSALDLIKNLAQWSKIQTNKIKLNLRMVDITGLINESVELMSAYADKKNIKIIKMIPEEIHVCADKDMISTILRNLIANAIKYSRPGEEIYIRAIKVKNDMLVEVRDSGIGIDAPNVKKIFSEEETISLPGTQNEPGSGLGLLLCREFVSRHGGKIWVDSEVEKGSTFTFSIPYVKC